MADPDAVDVRRLRRSALVAGLGDGVAAVALPLLAAGLTRDPLAVAGVAAAQHLPWVLLALAAPSLRHVDRRTLAGAGNSLRAVTLAFAGMMAVVGDETIVTIDVVAFVLGSAQALSDDAERVGGENLRWGATEAARRTLAGAGLLGVALLGLPLGGFLYELLAPVPLLLDVGVFAVAALFVLAVRRPLLAMAEAGEEGAGNALPRLARGTGMVTAGATVAAGASGAVAGILVLVALDGLGLGAPAFGLLLAGLAVSSTVGALLAPTVARVVGVRAGIATSLVVAAAGLVAAWDRLDPDLPYTGAFALGVAAAGAMAAGVLLRAHLYGVATGPVGSDGLRAFHLVVWAATPIGALVGGASARSVGVADVLIGAAAGYLVAAVLAAVSGRTRPAADAPANRSQKVP